MKYLNNIWEHRILKVKDGRLELSKDFKSINISINDTDKFGDKIRKK